VGHDLPREEMANTSLDDEVFVINVLGGRIESCANTITGKAGQGSAPTRQALSAQPRCHFGFRVADAFRDQG
jgi:hypothetical protein